MSSANSFGSLSEPVEVLRCGDFRQTEEEETNVVNRRASLWRL